MKVAVIGATCLVGQKMLQVLEEQNLPIDELIVAASEKSVGKKIIFNENEYYLFPTPEELSVASVEDLRSLGLGFRDKRIYETCKIINENKNLLKDISELANTNQMREELLKLDIELDINMYYLK